MPAPAYFKASPLIGQWPRSGWLKPLGQPTGINQAIAPRGLQFCFPFADTYYQELVTGMRPSNLGTTQKYGQSPFGMGLQFPTAATTDWIGYKLPKTLSNTSVFSMELISWYPSSAWSANSTDFVTIGNNAAAGSLSQYVAFFGAAGANNSVAGLNTGSNQTSGVTVSTPAYLHLLMTWDKTTLTFYINGAQVATVGATSLTGTQSAIVFGAAGGDTSAIATHLLCNYANVVWTPAEIMDRYLAPWDFLLYERPASLVAVTTGNITVNLAAGTASGTGAAVTPFISTAIAASAATAAVEALVASLSVALGTSTSSGAALAFPFGPQYVPAQSGVASSAATPTTSISFTPSAAISTGNSVCIMVAGADAGAVTVTVADNASGNTYSEVTPAAVHDATDAYGMKLFRCVNVQNNPTTFTASFGSSVTFPVILVDTFSNIPSNYTVDGSTGQLQVAPGTGTDVITSGAFTPASSGLRWGVSIDEGSLGGDVSGTGWTQAQYDGSSFLSEYILNGASGSTSVKVTNSTHGGDANQPWLTAGFGLGPPAGVNQNLTAVAATGGVGSLVAQVGPTLVAAAATAVAEALVAQNSTALGSATSAGAVDTLTEQTSSSPSLAAAAAAGAVGALIAQVEPQFIAAAAASAVEALTAGLRPTFSPIAVVGTAESLVPEIDITFSDATATSAAGVITASVGISVNLVPASAAGAAAGLAMDVRHGLSASPATAVAAALAPSVQQLINMVGAAATAGQAAFTVKVDVLVNLAAGTATGNVRSFVFEKPTANIVINGGLINLQNMMARRLH